MRYNLTMLNVDNVEKGVKFIILGDGVHLHPKEDDINFFYYSQYHEFEVVDFEISTINTGPCQSKVLHWIVADDGHGLMFSITEFDNLNALAIVLENSEKKAVDPVASAVAEELSRQANNTKTRA